MVERCPTGVAALPAGDQCVQQPTQRGHVTAGQGNAVGDAEGGHAGDEDLRGSIGRPERVVELQTAMDQAVVVGGNQRGGERGAEREGLFRRRTAAST